MMLDWPIGAAEYHAALRQLERGWDQAQRKLESDLYDLQFARGPMIERDIDWRAPLAHRSMQEGDL
jgi:hypothetical protein